MKFVPCGMNYYTTSIVFEKGRLLQCTLNHLCPHCLEIQKLRDVADHIVNAEIIRGLA